MLNVRGVSYLADAAQPGDLHRYLAVIAQELHCNAGDAHRPRHPSPGHVRATRLGAGVGRVPAPGRDRPAAQGHAEPARQCRQGSRSCLHVVRTDHGSALAADLARAIVLAPHRIGSQAQYIPTPVAAAPDNDAIGRAMGWARARLVEPLDLDRWAAAAHMSRRTFTRRFRERTSSSPQQWLLQQRIDHARMLLETGSAPIDVVAARSGFGSAVSLRSHFTRLLGISPAGHRALFRDMRAESVN
jgi:AraC-like DNA-binding protein